MQQGGYQPTQGTGGKSKGKEEAKGQTQEERKGVEETSEKGGMSCVLFKTEL